MRAGKPALHVGYEIAFVALVAIAAVAVSLRVAHGMIGLLGAALALVMLATALIDRQLFVIPDSLSAAGLILAVIHALALEPDAMLSAVALAAARGAALALTFLAVRSGYARLRGRQGLGLGDVKLAGVAGTWLDWSMMPIAVELAAVAALSFYLFRVGVLGRPSAALRLVLRAGRLAVLGFSKFHLNRQARSRDQQTEADSAAFERPPAAVFVPDGTSIALMKGAIVANRYEDSQPRMHSRLARSRSATRSDCIPGILVTPVAKSAS